MQKTFFKDAAAMREILIDWQGGDGCIVSDRIMLDGEKVGYMYREAARNGYDSGWRFFAGDENDGYCADADNFGIYKLNTVCNYDEEIFPFLTAAYGSAFGRDESGEFVAEDFLPPEDE